MEPTELEIKLKSLNEQKQVLDDEIEVLEKKKEASTASEFLKSLAGTEWTLDKYGGSLSSFNRDNKVNIDKIYQSGNLNISENTYFTCHDGELKIHVSPSGKAFQKSAKRKTQDRKLFLRLLIAFAKEYKIKVNLEQHQQDIKQCERTIKLRKAEMQLIKRMLKGK